jgi:hypothetical protein
MHVDNPIVAAEFDGRVPKSQQPRPESDWATVDIDAGPRQVVVLGCVLNGDSRHELACRDVSIDDTGELTRLSVTVQLEKHDPEGEVILTGPGEFYYRLRVEHEGATPREYRITHLDENGDEQLTANEVLFIKPGTRRG